LQGRVCRKPRYVVAVSGARAVPPEIKVHGQHACRALFERRADDVLRVYLVDGLVKPFGDLLHACAKMRRPYRVVTPDELERITESRHHEGICIAARPRPARALDEILREPGPGWLVALAGVSNPHNTGAILRSAAHFGARAVLLGGGEPRLPPAAHRTAQGGAEWLDVLTTPELAPALQAARRAGFSICTTSSRGGVDLHRAALPPRAVLLLGGEGEGVPAALAQQADLALRVPGTGHVESLNVAAAAAVLLAELWRRHGPAGEAAAFAAAAPASPVPASAPPASGARASMARAPAPARRPPPRRR
jgi:RNA methyltransferase, TrmH family